MVGSTMSTTPSDSNTGRLGQDDFQDLRLRPGPAVGQPTRMPALPGPPGRLTDLSELSELSGLWSAAIGDTTPGRALVATLVMTYIGCGYYCLFGLVGLVGSASPGFVRSFGEGMKNPSITARAVVTICLVALVLACWGSYLRH